MTKDQREIQRKLRILRHAEETGHCLTSAPMEQIKVIGYSDGLTQQHGP
jgi:hypothetical protein